MLHRIFQRKPSVKQPNLSVRCAERGEVRGRLPLRARPLFSSLVLIYMSSIGEITSQAQSEQTIRSVLFYLVENRETGDIIRRGTTTDAGLLPNELILAPSTIYRMWLYDPATDLVGFEDIETPTAGQRFVIPPIQLRIPMAPDSDNDGLSDDAEFVIGTDPNN